MNINPANQTINQYSVQVGSSNNVTTNVAPGSSGTILMSNGPSSLPSFQSASFSSGFSSVNVQVFKNAGSTTYTPTSNMKYCIVQVCGAGGGGGNVTSGGSPGSRGTSSGGGAGAYAQQIFTATDIGASQSVTIGTGGAAAAAGTSTTFGSFITCGGGSPGTSNLPSGNIYGKAGGAGGTVSLGGTITSPGGAGQCGSFQGTVFFWSGQGGDSYFSQGGRAGAASSINGLSGQAGSGGGGAIVSGATSGVGGSGGNGLVVITEFIA